MDSERFWQMIDAARGQADGWEEMFDPLVGSLEKLGEEEIFLWQRIFDEYLQLSYKNKLWAAAYVINGGCSDDGFDYFRAWLIAQGKDVFMKSLCDPESLADASIVEEDDAEFEEIIGAAPDAYLRKLGIEDLDYDRFYNELDKRPLTDTQMAEIAAEIKYASDIDNSWKEDGLEELLPRLCEAFGW